MSSKDNIKTWEHSFASSKPYWEMYEILIGPTNLFNHKEEPKISQPLSNKDGYLSDEYYNPEDEHEYEYEDDEVNQEYLEFIEITKRHQAEREKQKQGKQKLKLDEDLHEYYKDVSEVNTLVEANLISVPDIKDPQSRHKLQEEKLVKLYGGREAYDKIRSMEMYLDEDFNRKCQELSPKYWPAMPIKLRQYLNQIDS